MVMVIYGESGTPRKWAAEACLSAISGLNASALKFSAHVNVLSHSAFHPAGLARYAKQSLPTGGLRGAVPAALPWGAAPGGLGALTPRSA